MSGVLARGELPWIVGYPCDPRGKIGVDGMIPIPKRELGKMINSNPITIRVRQKGSRITREFVISNELVFQPSGGGYRFINTLDNFLRALISTQ